MNRISIATAILFAVIPSILLARLFTALSYEELSQQCDAIFICSFMSAREVDEAIDDPDFADDDEEDFDVFASEFRVLASLKGDKIKSIEVVHYRYSSSVVRPDNGPSFVDFSAPPYPVERPRAGRRTAPVEPPPDPKSVEYLLFLKKRPDGKYIPFGGQMDPGLSIRRIEELS